MSEETLFNEALARPAAERAAFLEQACAQQPELRAAVEALLAAHERSANVLDQPPVALGQTVDSEPRRSLPQALTALRTRPGTPTARCISHVSSRGRGKPANRSRHPATAPGHGKNRKHPALAVTGKGELILVWPEGTGWETGGDLAW